MADTPAAGWYPDPQTPGQQRYWDGNQWTQHGGQPGRPNNAKKFIIPLIACLGLLVILGVAGAIAGGGDDEASDETTTTAAKTTSTITTTTRPKRTTTTERTTTTTRPKTTTTTPSPERTIKRAVADALDDSNRDVDRVDVELGADGNLKVTYAINDNLTEGLIKNGARIDAVDILRAVRESGIGYKQVQLVGTFPLQDQLGNSEETDVLVATYPKALIDQINFDGFDFKNVMEITDLTYTHPTFQY